MITSLSLKNCFGFRDFTVALDRCTILVGPNNGGKTSILRAVKLLGAYCRQILGGNDEPNLSIGRVRNESVEAASRASGILDWQNLKFCRSLEPDSTVSLELPSPVGPVRLNLGIDRGGAGRPSILLNGVDIFSGQLQQGEAKQVLAALSQHQSEFIPSLGLATAVERLLTFPQLRQQLSEGHYPEVWRNLLYWRTQRVSAEQAQEIASLILQHLPGFEFLMPGLSRGDPMNVEVLYKEGDAQLDISMAGAGARTLVALASAFRTVREPVLLLDEPDAHLHASVQRQIARLIQDEAETREQVIVATHSSEFLDEFPSSALRWIDRSTTTASQTESFGRVLVDLGAMTNAHAIAYTGSDAFLFVEGRTDVKVIGTLLSKMLDETIRKRIAIRRLEGGDNVKRLDAAAAFEMATKHICPTVIALCDSDYRSAESASDGEMRYVKIIRLPCKELENLILRAPSSVHAELERRRNARQSYTGTTLDIPTLKELEAKIDELTLDQRDTTLSQFLSSRLKMRGTDNSVIQEVMRDFEDKWSQFEWRRAWVPGKAVVRALNGWLQTRYRISSSVPSYFESFTPEEDIVRIFGSIKDCFART